ncbi:MAG: hypothetical protein JWP06_602 [Candidatus Saccharibacteria bacterium]|nr:hypothetical protein [Candidatus Saccharibacteria bacterium]
MLQLKQNNGKGCKINEEEERTMTNLIDHEPSQHPHGTVQTTKEQADAEES